MTRTPKPRQSDTHGRVSMYDEYVSTAEGRAALAGAQAALDAQSLIERAFEDTSLSAREVADRLGISEGRVSQLRHGDGNLKLSTLGRLLDALGYRLALRARLVDAPVSSNTRDHEPDPLAPDVWVQHFADARGVYRHVYYAPEHMASCEPLGEPVRRGATSDSAWKVHARRGQRELYAGVRR